MKIPERQGGYRLASVVLHERQRACWRACYTGARPELLNRFPPMNFRFATPADVELLASLNAQLIADEGHRAKFSCEQLAGRMAEWLSGDYEAVLFEDAGAVAGYALYRRHSDHVYVRQFFVCRQCRRQGVGRRAIQWLWENAWSDAGRLRIDVLVGNTAGQAFWRSLGFTDYCITMEMSAPLRRGNLHE